MFHGAKRLILFAFAVCTGKRLPSHGQPAFIHHGGPPLGDFRFKKVHSVSKLLLTTTYAFRIF